MADPKRPSEEDEIADDFDRFNDQFAEGDDECPACKGRGTVNPLTAPKDFFCVGTTDCPLCDGTGKF